MKATTQLTNKDTRKDVAGRKVSIVSSLTAALLLVTSAASAEFGPFPNHNNSKWEGPYDLPIVPAAAANMPDGRVVTWSAQRKNHFSGQKGSTATSIFDPRNGSATDASISNTDHDMFCPGTAQLADGTFMITGGNNAGTTTIYDPVRNQWSIGAPMNITRGYHSMTTLHDGSVFTIGGSWSGGRGGKIAELWSPLGGWRLLPNVNDTPLRTADPEGVYRSDNHMWLFEAPNGMVFHAGPSDEMFWVDTDGPGRAFSAGKRDNDDDAMNGAAVMYSSGRILTLGGSQDYARGGSASNRAYAISVRDGTKVSVSRSDNMQFPRTLVNSVVLPSGEVVVIGGSTKATIFDDDNAVYEAEIWNPVSNEFRTLAKMKVPRTYHAFALLLRDGRVLAGGGGLCGGCSVNHADVEIFTPPYLLTSNGDEAPRPEFTSTPPSQANAGQTLNLKLSTSQSLTFSLVRLGAVTHSINNDQRRVPLDVTRHSGKNFDVRIPANPSVTSPGAYFLFALSEDGTPSVGHVINLDQGANDIPGALPADAIGQVALRSDHGGFFEAEGNDGTIHARGDTLRDPRSRLSAIRLDNGKIALRTFAGLYISAQPGGNVTADRTEILNWEQFELAPAAGNRYSLKTAHGTFLTALPNGTLVADRNEVREWETFDRITIGNNTDVSLESYHGTYVTGGSQTVGGASFRTNSILTYVARPNGKVALRTRSGTYVRADRDLTMDASATSIRDWEEFELFRNPDGSVSLKTAHGFWVSMQADGTLLGNRTEVLAWEKFQLGVVQ